MLRAFSLNFEGRFLFSFSSHSIEGNFMKVKVDKTLDCLGLYCPEPVFRTRMELDDMRIGEILEVLADDPAAESDIQSLVKNLEQEIISVNKEGNTIRILIKKVK
jgi:tRNA 2-thiouridine synthesizing protein A